MRTFCEICKKVKNVRDHHVVCWTHVCDKCYDEIVKFIEELKEKKKNG